jgi:hypothetical protein
MTDTWSHKYTNTRTTPGPAAAGIKATRIAVTAGLHKLDGNDRPYFSVTCRIDEQARNNRWQEAGGGADHAEILRNFPRLAPIVAMHLSDDNGQPVHAVANAIFFAGFSPRMEDAQNPGALARHLRITTEEADELISECIDADDPREALTAYVESQYDRWAHEARAAIALLDSLIAKTSEVSSPK